jgi:hypothetical protein
MRAKRKDPGAGNAGAEGFATSENGRDSKPIPKKKLAADSARANGASAPAKPEIRITAARLAMVKNGYLPIHLTDKRPLYRGWPDIVADAEMARRWETEWPNDRNTGSLTKFTPAIDIDILDPNGIEIIESLVRERFSGTGKLLRRVGKPPKCAFLFRTDEPFEKLTLYLWAPGEPTPEKIEDCKHRIEILGDGQQVVVHGKHPDTGKPYTWSGGEPWTVARDELPPLTAADAQAFLEDARKLLVEADWGVFEVKKREKRTAAETEDHYPLIIEIGEKLWGEPKLNGDDYRFGSKGSKGVNWRTGIWYDFETGEGGNQFDLLKKLKSSGGTAASPAEPKPVFKAGPFEWIEPSQIPKRQWLYRPHYIREFLSLLFSSGGKGKSSLLIAEALAMVSGKPLLNINPEKKLRVWYWNGEDPIIELQRRFAAAIKHYELMQDDIGDRLFFDSGRTLPIVIAEDEKFGTLICEPVIKDVIATLNENRIDVLIIDPFVACHRVAENDNSAIERVAKSWSHIAEETHCSILAAHHNRKSGSEGATVDDGRGASALRDAARTARSINTMTDREAEKAEIEPQEQGFYFRADIGKANLTPPAQYADWFKLVSVDLGNSDDGWEGGGDQVGVVTPWSYPVADVPRITPFDIARAQAAIRDGGPWRADQRSTREPWVGIPIAQTLSLDLTSKIDKRFVADLIRDWLGAGLLRRVDGVDDHHEARVYVEAGNAPVVPPTTGDKND